MVKQARKLPRLSDGYFDTNQTHSIEDASKSKDKSSEKVQGSPLTSNSEGADRKDDLKNRTSPRYHRRCSQRLKDKDHPEDSSKSPVVKSEAKCSKNKEHKSQTSSDKQENEKRLTVGDWSQQLSSSGKKYYYNCKTEVSQWEKPKEIIEWERVNKPRKSPKSRKGREMTEGSPKSPNHETELQQNLSHLSYDTNQSKDQSHEENSDASASKSKS